MRRTSVAPTVPVNIIIPLIVAVFTVTGVHVPPAPPAPPVPAPPAPPSPPPLVDDVVDDDEVVLAVVVVVLLVSSLHAASDPATATSDNVESVVSRKANPDIESSFNFADFELEAQDGRT